jgi:uncharacterized protein (DUF1499 family)
MSLISCTGKRPSNLGITDSQLAPCPSTPNCVSSDAKSRDTENNTHYIAPFQLDETQTETWQIARESVLELPRTQIINETSDYLHAECTSAILGFVDDLELHHRANENIIAIRSASRLGSSDFGVNRKRIESLKNRLIERGAVLK